MATTRIKLTKTSVEALQAPAEAYLIVRDTETRGFGLRVTASGVKSYFVERVVNGRNVRATVGRHGEISATVARERAEKMLLSMRDGIDPVLEKRARLRKADGVTFGQVAEAYISEREGMQKGGIKPSTAEGYRYDLDKYLAPLMGREAASITRGDVADLHKVISAVAPTAANRAMRLCRAVFNFVQDNDDYLTAGGDALVLSNPVAVLKKRRLWNPSSRKHNYLADLELGRWLEAVLTLDPLRWCETHALGTQRVAAVQAYLLLMVCLGLRSSEAAKIRRQDWNPETRVLTVADPKNLNSAGRSFAVPVGWRMEWVLNRQVAEIKGAWLIPNEKGDSHIVDPRFPIADVRERGAHFTPHDLRRTFASLLNSLSPAPSMYQIKRLLNHTPDRADVTTDYIQHDIETLRAIVQRVEDAVFGSITSARPLCNHAS
ncbi:integrase family protein [Uliginosibacterium sp. 31-12]|uniref:tyrosine-type recombinase/integrase n=1 Tax=Uliginosibacterium sp. 31-12 TaxID=3062781 RepID=UPI0026E2AAA8|nr:integrase family protein [Uliginosibacterium sp. 31-12]MDO6385634.1 integrase family protein [Uliginosibacterium sp. 31-12]